MRAIVVGAGLSGMTAAWELVKAGHETIVLEARGRVGGRTWSHRLENGETTERGGEYIFPDEHPIRRLAAELELPIMSHGVRYARRTVNGQIITARKRKSTLACVRSTLTEMLVDGATGVSLETAFAESLGADYRLHPVYRQVTTSAAADPDLVSAEAVLLSEASGASHIEDGGRLVGGNQALALELARRLGRRVRLEHPVTEVDQSASGVEVRLADGTALGADAAIISVPFPLLRELTLGFDLPERQQRALAHRFMGVAAKLAVPLEFVDSDTALQNSEHTWWSWRSLSVDGTTRISALSSFAGGPDTLQALRVEDGPHGWVSALQAMRPDLRIAGEPVLTTWADDPWARGSYTAPGLDWQPEDADAFVALAGRVAIAGEHTGMHQSLSGAVASGYRAAAALSRREVVTDG
ncbi:flavin monoamine oxidase family protein [Microbacterium azadirachtae]|uniref:Flavin containing amine oxidoreductase n=1 Tax=Microbacterium azadirachtae TaxID=582680 RepID=A0A1I6G756_9MICO|nr:NAD(P)/FAD-dependent oxidoreductase [Microbacterium azadirachtae]SDL36353.1 Flavin containing amine oxidoreductase [Microbacterium azadirachtae]SEF67101.1 Flavin containing amine oxidoreductase [Microbacterium azadirachtae]SEF67831.1 Flavin containing amine oxidoreductase [Microbacterium azadirachtae]SFR38024.1 Flavin containing amine oxidoreductase [Microbacterium azadirachtae]